MGEKKETDRQTDKGGQTEREREREKERERERWMDGLLYNQWIDHNNIVGKR